MDAANASGSQERVVIHFSSLNLYGFHNSTLPPSILAAGADFIGKRGPLLIAANLLPMRGEFLSGGEARRHDLHAQASGEGVKVCRAHGAERNAEFTGLVFADFAGLHLPVGEAVKGEADYVVGGDIAGEVV
jgi:hypothetical protein